jgi:transcriptional regulator with XRE-family HTH domain
MSIQVSGNVETSFVTNVASMQNPSVEQVRKEFGSWLRDRREALRLSQGGVADKVGVDRQTIYRIEAGQTGTRRDTVIALASSLGLNADEALIRSGWATPAYDAGDVGFFKGLEKLSPENQQAVKRAMQAMIESLSEQDHDTDYIDDETEDTE